MTCVTGNTLVTMPYTHCSSEPFVVRMRMETSLIYVCVFTYCVRTNNASHEVEINSLVIQRFN